MVSFLMIQLLELWSQKFWKQKEPFAMSHGHDSATPTLAELFCLSSRTLIRVCFRVSSRVSSDGQLRAGGIASSLLELTSRTRKYNTNTRWDKFELGA